jgi:hypothetical protein
MRGAVGVAAICFFTACDPGRTFPADSGHVADDGEFALTVSAGSFSHEAGAALALLATLRDSSGEGVSSVWRGEVRALDGEVIARFDYGDGSATRWVASWWPNVPLQRGAVLDVRVRDDSGRELSQVAAVPAQAGLDQPNPRLTSSADGLEWEAVARARAYRCDLEGPQGAITGSVIAAQSCAFQLSCAPVDERLSSTAFA